MRFFGVMLIIFSEFMADLPVSVNLTALFTSMTEYSAVDLRGLRRNASSKYCQRIFGSKIIGMYTVLTIIPELLL